MNPHLTQAEHYARAEKLLAEVDRIPDHQDDTNPVADRLIATATVHALLAGVRREVAWIADRDTHEHGVGCYHSLTPTGVAGVSVCTYCGDGIRESRYCPSRCVVAYTEVRVSAGYVDKVATR